MNGSTEHSLHEKLLHDALHAHVRESGGDAAGACLSGLADGALRVARRRQRLVRTGAAVATAVVVATVWVAVADGVFPRAHVVQPGVVGGTGNTGKAAPVSLLPVTSSTERHAPKAVAATPCTPPQTSRRSASASTGPRE